MLKYKMICTDLDDTLIGRKQQYGKGLKDAIKRYEQAGGKFVIVTGRMTTGALPVCRDLDLHGEVLTYQGAVVTDIDTGKTLEACTLDYRLAARIGKYAEENGLYYQTYRGDYLLTEKATKFTELYVKIAHASYRELGYPVSEYLLQEKYCPPKLLLMNETIRIPQEKEQLIAVFGEEALINTSKPFIIEIVPKGINKGIGVMKLAEKYGIRKEEIICVGDSDNDSTMLGMGAFGICVGNGSEGAKKLCKVIAPDCDNDPITWIIDTYGMQ